MKMIHILAAAAVMTLGLSTETFAASNRGPASAPAAKAASQGHDHAGHDHAGHEGHAHDAQKCEDGKDCKHDHAKAHSCKHGDKECSHKGGECKHADGKACGADCKECKHEGHDHGKCPHCAKGEKKARKTSSNEEKSEFRQKLDVQLDQVEAQIADLKTKAQATTTDAKTGIDAQIAKLETRRTQIEADVEKMTATSGRAWAKLKVSVQKAMNELEAGVQNAKAELDQKTKKQ